MSDGAQAQKFNILFDWFDQNHDGYVTQDDLQAMAGLFTGLPGGDSPENSEPLRDAFDMWWGLLLESSDADADARIARDEFIAIMKASVTAPGNFEDAVVRIADAFMRIVDTATGRLTSTSTSGCTTALASIPRIRATLFGGSIATAPARSPKTSSGRLSPSSTSVTTRTRPGTGCWDRCSPLERAP
jgi:hypothetical protein